MSSRGGTAGVETRTLVLIDGDNLFYATKSLGVQLDYAKLHALFIEDFGEGTRFHYYSTIRPSSKQQSQFFHHLESIGYSVRPSAPREGGAAARYTPAAVDVLLAVDAMSTSRRFDRIVLLSGDGDFGPLLEALRLAGKTTVLVSLPIVTSQRLIRAADQFVNLEGLISRSTRVGRAPKGTVLTAADERAVETFYLEKGLYYANYSKIRNLLRSAKRRICLVDAYINDEVLQTLSTLEPGVTVRIVTKRIEGADFFVLFRRLKREGRDIDIYRSTTFHDRFLRIDDDWWHLGHSIKDVGSADAVLSKISEPSVLAKLREREEEVYRADTPVTS